MVSEAVKSQPETLHRPLLDTVIVVVAHSEVPAELEVQRILINCHQRAVPRDHLIPIPDPLTV